MDICCWFCYGADSSDYVWNHDSLFTLHLKENIVHLHRRREGGGCKRMTQFFCRDLKRSVYGTSWSCAIYAPMHHHAFIGIHTFIEICLKRLFFYLSFFFFPYFIQNKYKKKVKKLFSTTNNRWHIFFLTDKRLLCGIRGGNDAQMSISITLPNLPLNLTSIHNKHISYST